ncbi:TRAF3-interacting protein 1-like isoform X2 [Ornithodoros turicata]|uniref:TRAF3-interacting protein 1-like isoform X2 n=1 Tax=Ornithodoros turicata TaxID=34597 RepID=UPI003138B2A5
MADEISSKVIKKTQDLLGSVIKKPPLHDKLLKKPPFRFLHDVIHNVIKTTKFLDGLYTADELNSENIKDKEGKVAFLQKAIDALMMVTGSPLSTRPSKIVAGHEPEKTNEFLQLLAKAAAKKMDSTEAVKRILAGERPSVASKSEKKDSSKKKEKTPKKESSSKTTEPKGLTNGEAATEKSSDKEKVKSARTNDTTKEASAKSRSKRSSQAVADDQATTSNGHDAEEAGHVADQRHAEESMTQGRAPTAQSSRPRTSSRKVKAKEAEANQDPQEHTSSMPDGHDVVSADVKEVTARPQSTVRPMIGRPPTSLLPDETVNAVPDITLQMNGDDLDSERPPTRSTLRTSRPRSSRPAAPRIRKRETPAEEDAPARTPTAKPVENLILDNKETEDKEEEEESFVVAQPPDLIISKHEAEADNDGTEQGSLVRQLLETKKELEHGSHQSPSISQQEKPLNRQQTRERSAMENLRRHIQSVSRSALPLGRLLDLMSEDLESMQTELRSWREEHTRCLKAYLAEQSRTESIVEPLKQNLEELDQRIAEQTEAISATKANLFSNEERLHRILAAANLLK